jgi:hypothetical protein
MCNFSSFAQNEQDATDYIEKYKKLAIEEQVRIGVPASITLAQGIHESSAGKSELATKGNNHFGIKCKSTWTGDTILHDDDKKQECFRKYISPEQSYIDHSDFLKGSNRYSFLFDLEVTDYIGWASGLKRAGYATNPAYVRRLTDLVEKYNLQQYTYEALKVKFSTPVGEIVPEKDNANFKVVDDPSNMYKGLKGFWITKGESLVDKSVMNNIRYQRLLELNDLPDAPLDQDMFIFLEKKRKTGTVEFHTVKDGENMIMIAQKEAMQLDNLFAFNNMKPGQEAEVGEQLTLQYRAYGNPKLKPAPIVEPPATSTATVSETKPKEEIVIIQQEAEKNVIPEVSVKEISNPAILDLEKARRTEALLSGKPVEEKIIIPVESKAIEIKKEDAKPVQVTYEKTQEAPKPVEEAPKPIEEKPKPVEEPVKPKPALPKRVYNEPGVSDSVKVLKEKFDQIVYQPLPEKKKIDPPVATPPAKKEETKPSTPTKKIEAKTTPDPKKADDKKVTGKTANVEKTPTGIKREAKKETPKKEDVKKGSKSSTKKDDKSSASKSNNKKFDSKKAASKPSEKKKTDPKKADPKKKK